MKPLVLLGLTLALTSCGRDGTALAPPDAGTGGTGTAGTGGSGSGGAGRGHPDGSIEVTGGTGGATGGAGGSTGGSSGSGGSTGGSGGTVGPDAGLPDAQPMGDAGDPCQTTCPALVAEYGNALRQELVCNPGA